MQETLAQRIEKQTLLLAVILAGGNPSNSLVTKLRRIVSNQGGNFAGFIGRTPEQLKELGFSDTQAARVFAAIALPNAGKWFDWTKLGFNDNEEV